MKNIAFHVPISNLPLLKGTDSLEPKIKALKCESAYYLFYYDYNHFYLRLLFLKYFQYPLKDLLHFH